MKYCCHCGSEMRDEAVVCVKCGCSVEMFQPRYQNAVVPYKEDKPEPILIIVSILFPIIGIIMGYVMASESPVASQAYRKAGWTVTIIEIIGFLLSMALFSLG